MQESRHANAVAPSGKGLEAAGLPSPTLPLSSNGSGMAKWMRTSSAPNHAQRAVQLAEQTAALLRIAGKIARIGGWAIHLPDQTLTWSDEVFEILEYPICAEPAVDLALSLYPPEWREPLAAAIAGCADQGTPFDLEAEVLTAGGRRLWVRIVGEAERGADGGIARVVGAFQDISDRVAERLALGEANKRLSLATESGRIGIWDWDLVNDTMTWDRQMYQLYDLEPEGSLATYELWHNSLHPDDAPFAVQAVRNGIDGIRPLDTDFRAVWKDGSVHNIRGTGIVTRDQAGRALRMTGANWDVTESRRLTAALAKQHELLDVTLRSIGDGVITVDAENRVLWLNPVAEHMTGWLVNDAIGKPLSLVFLTSHAATGLPLENPMASCVPRGIVAGDDHTVLTSRHGSEFGIEHHGAPLRNDQGELLGAVLVFHDITEQLRLSREIVHRATHDVSTGLINRSEFEIRLRRLLDEIQAHHGQSALLYIDLDQFKIVNDTCGHGVGDRLLRQVSLLLVESVRPTDTVARLGGDEFAVILEDCSAAAAQRVAQRICDLMDRFRFPHEDRRFRISASIGLVAVHHRWTTAEAILQAADTSCYLAKAAGGNRAHVWFDTDQTVLERRSETHWATRIEQALDEDLFVLYAQRIEPLHRDRLDGLHAEVLVRMVDRDGSILSPGVFLPAAERFHLASRIDRWVLERAICWMCSAASLAPIGCLNVNLSGQSVSDRTFHRWAIEKLTLAGPDVCRRLCIEITETSVVNNLQDARLFIEDLHALHVRVALDDFGAGASSFGYLKNLRVDFLKIDGQFIRNILSDRLDEAAVRCFVDVARVAGMSTVAECVESHPVLQRLAEIGVDFAQGYLHHRPEPIDAALLPQLDAVPIRVTAAGCCAPGAYGPARGMPMVAYVLNGAMRRD